MDDVDEVLAHFGVKGMKWGVRKARTAIGGGDTGRKVFFKRDLSGLTGEGKVAALEVLAVSGAVVIVGLTKR